MRKKQKPPDIATIITLRGTAYIMAVLLGLVLYKACNPVGGL